ncbi:unnamed protein product [Zymoseptoria tritici ST99CH_1E4]|uniref:Uncharacterized protein n=1 Tax=Zymoseptoria tritici ST99CH_1E4 TaxID=1276532 RepID=A0A2H1H9M2_ZYMTR|nr:unnamed protein product [Zymoseptoria tritici ST99CH_1E4]
MPEAHQYLNRVDFRGEAPPSGGTFQVAVDPFSVLPLLRHLHQSIFSANISTPPKSPTRRSLHPSDTSTPPICPYPRSATPMSVDHSSPSDPLFLQSADPSTSTTPRALLRRDCHALRNAAAWCHTHWNYGLSAITRQIMADIAAKAEARSTLAIDAAKVDEDNGD